MEHVYENGDLIRHIGRGTIYRILETPNENDLLEESAEPFYAYATAEDPEDKRTWRRAQSQVEDQARFVPATEEQVRAVAEALSARVQEAADRAATLAVDLAAAEKEMEMYDKLQQRLERDLARAKEREPGA